MPELTHLPSMSTAAPAPQRNGGANAARGTQNSAGNKDANAAQGDDESRPFASVLKGKCADTAGKDDAATRQTRDEDAVGESAAAAQLPAATDPPLISIDALIAQRLAAAARPDAATAAAAAAAAGAGTKSDAALPGAGREGTGLAGDPRASPAAGVADRDPRRALAAGVADTAADPKTALAGKDGAATGGTDFSALLGRLRQEGSAKGAAATQAADTPSSTLAMLMPANQIADTQSTSAARPATLIEAPVGSPMFADEAAQRVTWLAKNGIEHAEIRVTPPDMGPIQVSIDMSQNEASINFTVTQTDTRVALEDSLHRLEEMLADSGIALAQANVGQQDAGQQQAGRDSGRAGNASRGSGRGDAPGGVEGAGGAALPAAGTRVTGGVRGLVDTFA